MEKANSQRLFTIINMCVACEFLHAVERRNWTSNGIRIIYSSDEEKGLVKGFH